jgi:hypothetical protein
MIGMRKFLLIPILIFCIGYGTAEAQVVSGRFVTSMYGWERQDSIGQSTRHLRGYENIQLDFGNGDIALHTYFQGSNDFSNTMENDPEFRLFNIYLNMKNVVNLFDLKLGRQMIFGGVNYGSIDGGALRLRPTDGVEVMAYGGGLTPANQKTDFFYHIKDNWQLGGQVNLMMIENIRIGFSYMNRHRETSIVPDAMRPDAQLGLIPTTIDYGSRANQYGSVDAAFQMNSLWLFGRADYDFNYDRLSRAEIAGSYQLTPQLGLSLNLAHREPTIAYNSYFAMFEQEANTEAMLGIDYKVHPMLTVLGRVSTVMYEDETAYRVSLGVSNKYASVMYTKDVSYDGDLNGFNAQLMHPLFRGMFVPHIGMVYSTYALSDNLDKTSTWAAVLGAMVRPVKVLSFDVQAQYMTNKIYKSDMRIFARINYWFAEAFGFGKEEIKP